MSGILSVFGYAKISLLAVAVHTEANLLQVNFAYRRSSIEPHWLPAPCQSIIIACWRYPALELVVHVLIVFLSFLMPNVESFSELFVRSLAGLNPVCKADPVTLSNGWPWVGGYCHAWRGRVRRHFLG